MEKTIAWVVQENLSSDRNVYEAFKKIFEKHNITHEFVTVIPYDPNLPDFDRTRENIFYGSTTMLLNAYADKILRPGIFFDEKTFRMDVYISKYKELMLNCDASITTFGKVVQEKFSDEHLLFIRPVDDSKLFAGQVKTFSEIKQWRENIVAIRNKIKDDQEIIDNSGYLIGDDSEILISEPYKINKEWRNFIINGKVISSSRYMKNQVLSKDANDIPEEMINFCENACKIFTPHDVFVMDIAESGGDYYILECGCMNSVGFYSADQEKIVLAITEYVKRNQWKYIGL